MDWRVNYQEGYIWLGCIGAETHDNLLELRMGISILRLDKVSKMFSGFSPMWLKGNAFYLICSCVTPLLPSPSSPLSPAHTNCHAASVGICSEGHPSTSPAGSQPPAPVGQTTASQKVNDDTRQLIINILINRCQIFLKTIYGIITPLYNIILTCCLGNGLYLSTEALYCNYISMDRLTDRQTDRQTSKTGSQWIVCP